MKKFIIALIVLLVLSAGWYFLAPLVFDKKVNEDFPTENTTNQNNKNNNPAEQSIISQGEFIGADNFHQGSGVATVYKLNDNSLVLRFEDFNVTNGPDLRVILAKDPDNIKAGYIEIDKLKGNIGNQNYSLESNLNLTEYPYVVIYCKPFAVTFASALLN
ncbi:MAG: DM13 domain-containing protein [Candidatus Paceibacterota bacterium]